MRELIRIKYSRASVLTTALPLFQLIYFTKVLFSQKIAGPTARGLFKRVSSTAASRREDKRKKRGKLYFGEKQSICNCNNSLVLVGGQLSEYIVLMFGGIVTVSVRLSNIS